MKKSLILSLSFIYLLIPSPIQCETDQDLQAQLNTLHQTLNVIITQANLDPSVAQDLTDKTDFLNQLMQENIVKDAKDIHVATGLSSILESGDAVLQAMNVIVPDSLAANLKYSARINTIQKLIIGAYKGNYSKEQDYTNPYIETIGFTLNDWVLNSLFQALANTSLATSVITALNIPPMTPTMQSFAIHTIAAITAHCAWTLEKRIFIPIHKKIKKRKKQHNWII